MAEEVLHSSDVSPLGQEVGRKRMTKRVAAGRLGDAGGSDGALHGLLHRRGRAVVAFDVAAPWVFRPGLGREDVLPAPLVGRIRVLAFEGRRHGGGAVSGVFVFLPDGTASPELTAEGRLESGGKHRASVFFAFSLPHRDLLIVKVQVLDAESEGLGKPQARSVQEADHEAVWSLHFVEDSLDLLRREHHGQPVRLLRPVEVGDPVPVAPEDLSVQEQDGIEGLILRRGRDGSFRGEVGEVRPDVGFFQVTGVCGVVVFYVSDNPAGVGLLGAVAVAFSLAGRPDAVEEERGSLRRRGHDEEREETRRSDEFASRQREQYPPDTSSPSVITSYVDAFGLPRTAVWRTP